MFFYQGALLANASDRVSRRDVFNGSGFNKFCKGIVVIVRAVDVKSLCVLKSANGIRVISGPTKGELDLCRVEGGDAPEAHHRCDEFWIELI